MNTIQRTAKTWFITSILVVLIFIFFYYFLLKSYELGMKNFAFKPNVCHRSWKWERLKLNVSRRTKLFLKVKDFFWHQHTVKLPLPYGTMDNELILQKILASLTNHDMPTNVESLKCRSCVVVGNGFSIKNSSLGDVINKYDVVIRLNNAPVRGYEDDVGNKTTMRFFYPESAHYNPSVHNQPDTLMVFVPFKQQDLLWLKWIVHNEKMAVIKGFWRPPPLVWLGEINQLRVLDPFFIYKTATHLLQLPIFKHQSNKKNHPAHPTTGILAVYVALNYCDVVHVAGFGYPSDTKQPIHYYGQDTMKAMVDSFHSLSHEAKTLKWLEDSGVILYLHPHL